MAFWGVQVKPGTPYTHPTSRSRGRLHISQATLGLGSASVKCILQCNLGNKSPVFLCSLVPERKECCQLNVEFEELQPVTLSVIGPRSIHITGYYQRISSPGDDESSVKDSTGRFYPNKYYRESYGEDIAMTESDRSLTDNDYDYSDGFIDDSNDLVVPETSSDEDRPRVVNRKFRRLTKKYQSPKKEKTRAPSNGSVGKEVIGSDSDAAVDDFFISLKKKDMEAAGKDREVMDDEDKQTNKEEVAAGDVSPRPVESVSPQNSTKKKRKKKKQLEEAELETNGECSDPKGSATKKKKRKKSKTNRMLEFEEQGSSDF